MATKHLNERGKMFLKSNHLADCSFHFPDSMVELKANKSFLALASPIMDTMFFGSSAYVEAETAIVVIHDIDVIVFEKFLSWVYAKEVDLQNMEEAIAVYYTANKYEVADLELTCEQFIVANVNAKCLGLVWNFCHLYNKIELKEKALKLIQRHTTQVLHSPNFLTSDVSMLQEILEQNELWIDNEMTLFEALERFAKTRSENRENLDAAVKCIRFKIIDVEKFIKFKSVLLTDEEKMAIVANIKSEKIDAFTYPEEFSKSIIPRCTDYVHISECDERLLKCIKEIHYSGEEITYMNYDEQMTEGTIGDTVFDGLEWDTSLKINSILRNHLPRQRGEDNNKYLTRIFEDDNPTIIVAFIDCLKCLDFPDVLEMNEFSF